MKRWLPVAFVVAAVVGGLQFAWWVVWPFLLVAAATYLLNQQGRTMGAAGNGALLASFAGAALLAGAACMVFIAKRSNPGAGLEHWPAFLMSAGVGVGLMTLPAVLGFWGGSSLYAAPGVSRFGKQAIGAAFAGGIVPFGLFANQPERWSMSVPGTIAWFALLGAVVGLAVKVTALDLAAPKS